MPDRGLDDVVRCPDSPRSSWPWRATRRSPASCRSQQPFRAATIAPCRDPRYSPPVARPPRPSIFYSFAALVSWPIVRFAYRYRASGKELLPAEGGYVLAAGHVSNFDPWALGLAIWPRRFLRFMAKSELFWFPLSAAAAGRRRVQGLPRHRPTRPPSRPRCSSLATGHVIAMFPEGTRRRKGLRKKYEAQAHTGAARIALEAGVPLVPGRDQGHRRPGTAAAVARPLRRAHPARRSPRAATCATARASPPTD